MNEALGKSVRFLTAFAGHRLARRHEGRDDPYVAGVDPEGSLLARTMAKVA